MNETNNFTWLPFFNAMLKKICSEYDKKTLYKVFNKVFQKDVDLGVLDPLTFIAFCNYSNGDNNTNKQALCDKAKKELRLDEYDAPTDFDGIPYFDARFQRFFFRRENEAGTIDFLWEFAKYVINHNGEISDDLGNELDSVIFKIHNKNCISWEKLSKFLFICFPNKYFPADENTRDYTGWEKLDNFEDFKNYQQALKNKYNEPPYIVSHKAWKAIPTEYPNIWAVGYAWSNGNQDDRFIRDNIWQYHHPTEKDLENFNNVKIGDIFALKSTYTAGPNHKITAAKIRAIGQVKEKIDDETFSVDWQIQDLPKEFRGCFCPWTTIGKFKPSKSDEIIKFIREYIEGSITMQKPQPQMKSKPTPLNIPLNQILYGPPGTGKTYNTVIKAMEIINPACIKYDEEGNLNYADLKKAYDEAKDNHQIEFVTFHQSYAYEEFVEGIKPALDSEDLDCAELKYVLKDGIFKQICKRAETSDIQNNDNLGIKKDPAIWKVSLKGSGENAVRKDCMENDRIRIGWDEYGEEIEETDKYSGKEVLFAFMDKMQIGDIVLSCYSAETIDAIGVITSQYVWDSSIEPKGYSRYRKVKWLVKGLNYNILKINNDKILAPATVYRLNNISLKDILDIINSKGQVVKYTENSKPYVLIIDEINRGNISKIFGELITLIEPDKRQGAAHEIKAKLPYSQSSFAVPQNLYIIGTMNTSDRSIAAVDIALRRRFKFIEMMPDSNLVANFGIEFQDIFEKLNKKIKLLLDRDHQIGHSYFIKTKYKNADAETLKQIWFQEILPLLNEYFYCDWEKLKLVVPGFITKVVDIPAELKDECEDSSYEFKTEEDFKNIDDFTNALNQDKFEKGN